MPEITRVVFRKWRKKDGGDVIALFPETKATHDGTLCDSYQHIGQHGAAQYHGLLGATRPATEAEYKDLKAELEQSGYTNLKVIKRFPRKR